MRFSNWWKSTLRRRRNSKSPPQALASAPLFAALGDRTRLQLVSRLCSGGPASLAKLSAGLPITRQAITKHLRAMERTGLVNSRRQGRQMIWRLERRRLREARHYLESISSQWDYALARLRQIVED
jgi:DNA-binding transcriptional ArsR family regulator